MSIQHSPKALTQFHANSVKAHIRSITGLSVHPISDGSVIYFAPGEGKEGESNAKKIVEMIATDFKVEQS